MTRCFLGFELTDSAREYLIERVVPLHRKLAREEGWPVRLVPPENWHATLLFFPGLEKSERAEVWEAVKTDAENGIWSNLAFPWTGLGLWPSPRRPGLICLEAPEAPKATEWPMVKRLDAAPFHKGEGDHLRRYRPHVTLMRLRLGRGGVKRSGSQSSEFKPSRIAGQWRDMAATMPIVEPAAIVFDRISFFLSTVSPENPVYPREHTLVLPRVTADAVGQTDL